MKIFLDSADLSEIETAASTHLLDGITTNPSLVAKTGMKFEQLLQKICELVNGPISAEVTALKAPQMLEQGRQLAQLHPNIVIKVPLTTEGLKATKVFSDEGIKTNVTLCFQPVQALLAAKCGATFISPFVGRLDDIGEVGMNLVEEIRFIYDQYQYDTQILAASIRHTEHVLAAARAGADVATIPYKVFTNLLKHPLTDIGLKKFLSDWEASGQKI